MKTLLTKKRWHVLIAAIATILAIVAWRSYCVVSLWNQIHDCGGIVYFSYDDCVIDADEPTPRGSAISMLWWPVGAIEIHNQLIDDANRPPIWMLRSLNHLDLSDCNITGQTLVRLRDMKSVSIIRLDRTNVSDQDMECLLDIKGLEHIGINGTQVGDKGLQLLAGVKPLKLLGCRGSKITDKGEEEFRRLRPDVTLWR